MAGDSNGVSFYFFDFDDNIMFHIYGPAHPPSLTPLGLTGPGLTSPGVFPHMAIGTHLQSFDLTGQVACDQVPLPVPATAYQMRMQVDNGSQRSAVDVALPLAASAVAQRVTYGCSTWLAARDLTVSTTSVDVSPTEAHLLVTVQVRNDGSHDGVVWMGSTDGTGIRVSDLVLTVPAHGTAQADLTVDLDTCWTWDASSTPLSTTDTPVPLLGAIGVDQPLPADAVPAAQGVTGLVLAPGTGRILQDAFVQACGGIAEPQLSTGVHSSSYVVGTQTLTTQVLVDLPTPAVQRVRFVPVTDPTMAGPAVPTYAPSPWLGLDSTGRVGWPLGYLVPPNIVCITGGGGVWVSTDVQAQVRTPQGTTRVVTFRLAAEALLPSPQIRAACDAMNAAAG
jgi:hypothetical protein